MPLSTEELKTLSEVISEKLIAGFLFKFCVKETMHSVSQTRAEKFNKLWGVREITTVSASTAWGDLREININHKQPILAKEFPERATLYLQGGKSISGQNDLDAIFVWLRRYAIKTHPSWDAALNHTERPVHFGHMILSFFINLRNIYLAGELVSELPGGFWPWFVGVLNL